MNMLDFLEESYNKLDEGKAVDAIYLGLYFAKVFDKIWAYLILVWQQNRIYVE